MKTSFSVLFETDYFVVAETIYLIFAYPKNEKDNLTDEERNNIKKLIDRLEQSL